MSSYEPRQDSTYGLMLFRHDYKDADGNVYPIDFWDTAGQETFNKMHPSYYDRADCCILVCDATRVLTYQNFKKWYSELSQYRKGIPVLVVVNQIDRNRGITTKPFKFAEKRNFPLFFCSAAEGTNVVAMFHAAIEAAIASKLKGPKDFIDSVYATLDYFEQKENTEKKNSKST